MITSCDSGSSNVADLTDHEMLMRDLGRMTTTCYQTAGQPCYDYYDDY